MTSAKDAAINYFASADAGKVVSRNAETVIRQSGTAANLAIGILGGAVPVDPPDPPSNLVAEAGNTIVHLTWTKSSGATGYKVYRDGVLIDTVGDVALYDDDEVDNGTEYSYRLKATNAGGDSSLTSAVTATPEAPVPSTMDLDDAVYGGPHTSGSGLFSRNYRGFGQSSQLDFTVSGASLASFGIVQNVGGAQYSIDGGSFTTIVAPGADVAWVKYSISLPDTGTHQITIKELSGGIYLDATNGIGALGVTAPTFGIPSALANTALLTPHGNEYVHDEGEWDAYPGGAFDGALYGAWPFLSLRLKATGPVSVYGYLAGQTYTLTIDGTADGTIHAIPSTGAYGWSGDMYAGDAGEHEIVITFLSGQQALYQIAAPSINTTLFARRGMIAFYGDSKTALTGPTTPLDAYQWLFASPLYRAICSRGIGFTTMAIAPNEASDTGGLFFQKCTTQAGANTSTNIAGTSHPRVYELERSNPENMVCWYGANDMADNWFAANAANGHEAPFDLLASYTALLEHVRDNVSNTNLSKFFAVQLEPRTDVSDPVRATWNTTISGAVTAASDARFTALDTDSLPAGGIHPGDAGHAALAALLLAASDLTPP